MKKILILIILLGFNSCESIDQYSSAQGSLTRKNAHIVHEICVTLDLKQEKDGVYKSSDGVCVVTGDYPMTREGEQCKSKVHCEIEEMREARLQRVIKENQRFMTNLEILEKLPKCKGLNGGEKSKVVYKNDKPYCILKRSDKAAAAASRVYSEKLKADMKELNRTDPVKNSPNSEPIARTLRTK